MSIQQTPEYDGYRATYDGSADALYVTLNAGEHVHRTLSVIPSINIDLDKEGRPIGLEILGPTIEHVSEAMLFEECCAASLARCKAMTDVLGENASD